MHVLHVVGARPNFMKAAPVYRGLERLAVRQTLVHTGQHYDDRMCTVFFDELGLPKPDVDLGVGSGTHALQTAAVMERFEPVVLGTQPTWVVVYGDVNSTVAAALVCSKLGIRVAHVEAGLRSWDRTMPEEINRLVTDQLADLLLTHSPECEDNLAREGVDRSKVKFVGNTMIDTLVRLLPKAVVSWPDLRRSLGLEDYALVTLHRPSNVDSPDRLALIMAALEQISHSIRVVFPVHPRTRAQLNAQDLIPPVQVTLLEPQGYLAFLSLQAHARVVITDSGGVQEETTYLEVPCLTLRANTERPVTIAEGTNRLLRDDPASIVPAVASVLNDWKPNGRRPALWDGHAGDRIAGLLAVK
ncbi:MAG: UDP-N-acetylglucosamine 2-epimerase (non-hydrolyzing) [Acidobacteria bacterium]|nr:UDP-N-acetylglucosamine 2-epimerase (non-hydrolyzing) [Acidobacteriota bacterium]